MATATSFVIKSLKEVQSNFVSYSAFREYFDSYMEYYIIPCRKCDECKMQHATDWAIRCAHEFHTQKKGVFITLTIDDNMVSEFTTAKYMKSYCTKCVKGNRYIRYPINYTLCKGLVLDFLKRLRDNLRKKYNVNIRYFGCGEYGTNDERPHYHVLIFGYDFPDSVPVDISKKGFPIYHSEELQNYWRFGLTTVQELNTRSCFYTAKYCLKKLTFSSNEDFIENYHGREPEFLFMSKGSCNALRCPYIDDIITSHRDITSLRSMKNSLCKNCKYKRGGIGFDFFHKYYKELVQIGYIQLDGVKYKFPKYYMDLLKLTDDNLYYIMKLKQLNSIDELDIKHFDRLDIDRLNVKKKIIKNRIKKSQNRL